MSEEIARQDFIDNVFIETRETEDYQLELYGQCDECHKPNTGRSWCRACNATHFRKNFSKWTSGNKEMDYFIQNTQIHAYNVHLGLEWYPWESFSDIQEIGKGGYATVFRAKTKVGHIKKWDHQKNDWSRYSIRSWQYVTLKTMRDS